MRKSGHRAASMSFYLKSDLWYILLYVERLWNSVHPNVSNGRINRILLLRRIKKFNTSLSFRIRKENSLKKRFKKMLNVNVYRKVAKNFFP